MLKKLLVTQLILATFITPALAQNVSTGLTLSKELSVNQKGNEYVSGDYPGAVLMKINLWGAVNRSGIHYVPAKTDLVTLLSYAGGPTDRAKLDEVIIKRLGNGKEFAIDVDVEELLEGKGQKSPILEANDIIVIPATRPTIDSDTVTVIGVAVSILSIAATGYLVYRSTNRK